jgi:hypothetical protein
VFTSPETGSQTRNASGDIYSSLQFLKEGGTPWGSSMTPLTDGSYGLVASQPWLCKDVIELVYGKEEALKDGEEKQLCQVEMRTTGQNGEGAVVIIGLNIKAPNDRSLDEAATKDAIDALVAKKEYEGPAGRIAYAVVRNGLNAAAAKAQVFDPSTFDVANALPIPGTGAVGANLNINTDAVAEALYEMRSLFSSQNEEAARSTCLGNYRTWESNWTDLAAHMWCQIPVSSRSTYVTTLLAIRAKAKEQQAQALAEAKKKAEEAGQVFVPPPPNPLKTAALVKQLHKAAFAAVASDSAFKTISTNKSLNSFFFALMTSVDGVADYNVDLAQEAIQKFYEKTKLKRLRRINDTYPTWLSEQPRYIEIRLAQQKNIFLQVHDTCCADFVAKRAS